MNFILLPPCFFFHERNDEVECEIFPNLHFIIFILRPLSILVNNLDKWSQPRRAAHEAEIMLYTPIVSFPVKSMGTIGIARKNCDKQHRSRCLRALKPGDVVGKRSYVKGKVELHTETPES